MKRSITLTFLWVFLLNTFAASFTPGNIVVTRVGPTVSTTGAKAYLDEYTTAGVLVQTIALPTDFYVPATADCGLTSISGDGQYLSLSGMPAAQLPTTAATAYARKILTVNYDGTVAAYTPTVTTPTAAATKCTTLTTSNTVVLYVGTGLTSPNNVSNVTTGNIAVNQLVFGSGMPVGGGIVTSVTGNPVTSFTLSSKPISSTTTPLTFMTSNTPIYANYKAPKGVFTTDGSNFWLGSEEKYIQYYNPNVNGGVPTNIVADDARYLTSVDGLLFKAVRYGQKIASIGTSTNPFPTTAANAVNASKINDSNDAMQIIALDIDATVAGQDVMYVAENNGIAGSSFGIKKYSKVGTTWTYNGGFGTFTEGYMGVTAKVTAQGVVTVYAINRPTSSGYNGGQLIKYVDNAGYNVAPNLTETTVLQSFNQATSPLGGAWRSVNFVPVTNKPDAPTSIVATAGNGQASVSFSAPASNGGSAITLYTVTSSPDGKTATGTTVSPITVANLTNGTAYTFTVTAANINGTGASSIASSAVMPDAVNNIISVLTPTNLSALTLTAVSDVKVSSTLTVDDVKAINSLTVEAGGALKLSSSTLSVVDLILKSDQTTTSSVSVSNAMAVSGTVKLLKTIDNTKWYFMSFPSDVAVNAINKVSGNGTLSLGTNWWIKYYDGASRAATKTTGANWKLINAGETLDANKGYIIGLANSLTGDYVLSFPINKNLLTIAESAETNRTVPVGAWGEGILSVAEQNHGGWNLVGMPYLSKFAGSGVGAAFITTPKVTGVGYDQKIKSEIGLINPFEAFFIQASTNVGGTGLDLSFATGSRQLAKNIVDSDLSDRIQLNFTSATGTDKTGLIMDNNQSTAYEINQDLEKWLTTGTDIPQVYSVLGGINYAYNALPMNSVVDLPIGIYTKSAGTTTISANGLQAPSLSKLLLLDKTTGTTTDLLTSNYSFAADAGTDNTRFVITAQRVPTANVIETGADEPKMTINNSQLIINNLGVGATVRVFDAIGRMVVNKSAVSNSLEVKLSAIGIYTVQIEASGKNWVNKIVKP
jgi:hypothetical protein